MTSASTSLPSSSATTTSVASSPPSSYSPFGSKPKAPENSGGYLSGLTGATLSFAAPSLSSPQTPSSSAATTASAASPPASSYSPFGSKPKAPESQSGYLGGLTGTTLPSMTPAASHAPASYSNSVGTSVASPPQSSYSPFGSKPKAPESQSGYLSALNGAPTAQSYSPFGSKPKATENQGGYLSGLQGAALTSSASSLPFSAISSGASTSSVASPPHSSYSPFGSKPKAPQNLSGYLGGLDGAIGSSSAATSATVSFGSSSPSNATPKPASYLGFGQKPRAPAAAHRSGYLGSLDGANAESPSYAQVQSYDDSFYIYTTTSQPVSSDVEDDLFAFDEESRVLDLLAQADVRLSGLHASRSVDDRLDLDLKKSAEMIEKEIEGLEAKLRQLDDKIAAMNGLDKKVSEILKQVDDDVFSKEYQNGAGYSIAFGR